MNNQIIGKPADKNKAVETLMKLSDNWHEVITGVCLRTKNKTNTFSDTTRVKIKKLSEDAVIPSYSKSGDAGMDLTITKEIENTSFSVSYGFGIAMEIPKGHVGLVFPRSSVRNQDLILSNCVGVIDSGYRGELQATFNKNEGPIEKYQIGDRIAQIM